MKNLGKSSQNYEIFAATLLLHNLLSATHPPLPSAKTFFIAARQCYFETKTIKQPYFSILSSIIICRPHSSPHTLLTTSSRLMIVSKYLMDYRTSSPIKNGKFACSETKEMFSFILLICQVRDLYSGGIHRLK